jgi:hypothetical protein
MLKKLLVPAVGPIIYSHLQSKGYSAMKTVYLVRHAKSSWTDPRLPDKDRPLKGRGSLDAVQMAESFRATLPKPDRIYSSPATRALHTAMLFAQTLGISPETFLQLVLNTPARSEAAVVKGNMMVNEQFEPQSRIRQHLKDVQLMLDMANLSSQNLPLSQAHAQLMRNAIAEGDGELDNAAIIRQIRREKSQSSQQK